MTNINTGGFLITVPNPRGIGGTPNSIQINSILLCEQSADPNPAINGKMSLWSRSDIPTNTFVVTDDSGTETDTAGGIAPPIPIALTTVDNTALGLGTLGSITVGVDNVVVGTNSGLSITSASDNVILGDGAGAVLSTGNNNIIIGSGSTVGSSSGDGRIVIGSGATTTLDNYVQIGPSTVSGSARMYFRTQKISDETWVGTGSTLVSINNDGDIDRIASGLSTSVLDFANAAGGSGLGGNSLTVNSGNGDGVGDGGDIIFNPGSAPGIGTGGNVIINPGTGGASGMLDVNGDADFSNNVTINGNLTVSGVQTILGGSVTGDNILTVNAGASGSADGGFVVERFQTENDVANGDIIQDAAKISGTLSAGSANGGTFPGSFSSTNDFYNGWVLRITNNSPAGVLDQIRFITDYDGGTRIFTVSSWSVQPDNSTTFSLYNQRYVGTIYDESADEFAVISSATNTGAQLSIQEYVNVHSNQSRANILTTTLASINGITFKNGVQSLTGTGAIDTSTLYTEINIDGLNTGTLIDGSEGQVKIIMIIANSGTSFILSPTNIRGSSTILFNNVGQIVYLLFQNGKWNVVSNEGSAASVSTLSVILGAGNITGGTDIAITAGDNITFDDNVSSSLSFDEGANSYLTFRTTNSSEGIVIGQNIITAIGTNLGINGDNSTNATTGGSVTINGGGNTSTGSGGLVNVTTGTHSGTASSSGAITINTGDITNGANVSDSGRITIQTGETSLAGGGSCGDIRLYCGTAAPLGAVDVIGNIQPQTTNVYDLGTTSLRWNNIYANNSLNVSTGFDIVMADNSAAAFTISENANPYMSFVTTNGAESIDFTNDLHSTTAGGADIGSASQSFGSIFAETQSSVATFVTNSLDSSGRDRLLWAHTNDADPDDSGAGYGGDGSLIQCGFSAGGAGDATNVISEGVITYGQNQSGVAMDATNYSFTSISPNNLIMADNDSSGVNRNLFSVNSSNSGGFLRSEIVFTDHNKTLTSAGNAINTMTLNRHGIRLYAEQSMYIDNSDILTDLADAAYSVAYNRSGGVGNFLFTSFQIGFIVAGGTAGIIREIDLDLNSAAPSTSRYDMFLQRNGSGGELVHQFTLIPGPIAAGAASGLYTIRVPPMPVEAGVNYRFVITRVSGAENLDLVTNGAVSAGTSTGDAVDLTIRTAVTTLSPIMGTHISSIKRERYLPSDSFTNISEANGFRQITMTSTTGETPLFQGPIPFDINYIVRMEIIAASNLPSGNSNTYRFRLYYDNHRKASSIAVGSITADVIDTTSTLAFTGAGGVNYLHSFDLIDVATSGPSTTNGKYDFIDGDHYMLLTADHSANIAATIKYFEMILYYV